MKPLTPRQQQVLDFIRDHITGFGYPPTLREIAQKFFLSGPRAAVKHLVALERKGHIRRSPGSSRGIEVLFSEDTPGFLSKMGGAAGIPVIGRVPAGPLDAAVEDVESTLILDRSIAGDGTFLLRVKGDSMIGDHILPDDMILVRKQDTAEDGDIVVVLIGEEATLKRFRRDNNRITLIPSNPDYDPVVFAEDGDEIRIAGKVKAVIRLIDKQRN